MASSQQQQDGVSSATTNGHAADDSKPQPLEMINEDLAANPDPDSAAEDFVKKPPAPSASPPSRHNANEHNGVTWRKRLANSLRKRRVGSQRSSGAAVVDASSFVYQPPRGSPTFSASSSKKRGGLGSPSIEPRIFSGSRRASYPLVEIQAVKTAIEEEADGLPYEITGGTPLHYYVWTDNERRENKRKEKIDFFVTLLTAGEVEVDAKTEEGNTALHLAVKKGDVDSVKLLLSFSADVNVVNSKGQTPLDMATAGYLNHERRLAAVINKKRHRDSPLATSKAEFKRQRSSPTLLSTIVPTRPKFVDCHLDGDFDGWVSVDFTDGPVILTRPKARGTEARERDLTDPVQITLEDVQHTQSRQVSTTTVAIGNEKPTLEEDEELRQSYDSILNILHATGGMGNFKLQHTPSASGKPISLSGKHAVPDLSMELERSIRVGEYENGSTILSLYEALEDTINMRMEELGSLGNPDEAIALTIQQQEMKRYNKTLYKSSPGELVDVGGGGRAGSRVLCLDGGGIRGLIQIEILAQIERKTGRKIIDLFDWIIGTSTGAIIALGLTYGNMSVDEVRLLYFKMKTEVFTGGGSYGFNTQALEKLLQETFPNHMCMDCMDNPKVLVCAVYKKVAPLQLHFFNNCFGDEYSKQPVWKVARYTSAAPMFFKECEDYVDGGVLANNPSESGLTAIQNYHHSKGTEIPIALVVSIGSGVYPAEALGRIDVQDFLFFGKQWLNFQDTLRRRAKNLIQLLSNALVESETVAENTKARCEGQGTPFFRFSPKLPETVATGETDNIILINMLISTMVQTIPRMEDLHKKFQSIAEANQKARYRQRKAKVTAV